MVVRLGSNISSLRAQRQLALGGAEVSRVYERLSSGLRINRAADDAAGLSIASSLATKKNVYAQGVRNGNDGISLLSIADSALESLSGIVTRIRELATQAASSSYTANQRAALDAEAQALSDEYTRIVQSTSFNTIQLFDGSLGNGLRIQLGFGADGSILSSLGGAVGTGDFTNGGNYNVGTVTATFAVGDVNGDGILDMVQDDGTSSGISVLIGNGDGTFRDGQNFAASSTGQIELADLNNDGILDIVTDQGESLLGNGDGTFATVQTAINAANITIDFADFDGDGILDVVYTKNDSITVTRGLGDGTFDNVGALYSDNLGGGVAVTDIAIGDFNGDGIKDFAVAYDGASSGGISTFINNGVGGFAVGDAVGAGEAPNYIEVADFNNDRVDDILFSDTDADEVRLVYSDTSANLNIPTNFLSLRIQDVTSLGIADFNGDGLLDFVAGASNGETAQVYLNSGDGSFQHAYTHYISGESLDGDLEVGDFNGDGVSDFALRSSNTINVALSETEDGVSPLQSFTLETAADARQAFGILDTALSNLNGQRGVIGAFQSRLFSAINTLQSGAENFQIAESRIRDVDVAQESGNLVRLQILQNSSAAVLAQANLQSTLVLSLLSDN